MTEQEMREQRVPSFDSMNELIQFIEELKTMDHDYGTSVYAMSMAAVATFNHVARSLGVTGFQASCADLDILRRTRQMEGPFMILNLNKALYPQYNLHEDVDTFIHGNIAWLREQAQKHLEENSETEAFPASSEVIAHWEALVSQTEE